MFCKYTFIETPGIATANIYCLKRNKTKTILCQINYRLVTNQVKQSDRGLDK